MDYGKIYAEQVVSEWRQNWRARVLLLVFQVWGAFLIGFAVERNKFQWFLVHLALSIAMSFMIGRLMPARPRGGHAPDSRS
jgi:hypothetical protein